MLNLRYSSLRLLISSMRLLIASFMRLLIDHFLLLVHGMILSPIITAWSYSNGTRHTLSTAISGTGQEIKGSLFMRFLMRSWISHQCEVMYIDRWCLEREHKRIFNRFLILCFFWLALALALALACLRALWLFDTRYFVFFADTITLGIWENTQQTKD